jgi:hypothetical protein
MTMHFVSIFPYLAKNLNFKQYDAVNGYRIMTVGELRPLPNPRPQDLITTSAGTFEKVSGNGTVYETVVFCGDNAVEVYACNLRKDAKKHHKKMVRKYRRKGKCHELAA